MKLKIFSVYDVKANAYMQPFCMGATGQAIRAWETTVNDQKTDFYNYPGDFTLFEIGSFNQETGELERFSAPINLGTALQFKKVVHNNVAEVSRISKEGLA